MPLARALKDCGCRLRSRAASSRGCSGHRRGLVQARHVLAHQDGIIDVDDVAKSGDHRYADGQPLVVTTAEVRRLADITEKLAAVLA